jgi:hypothetical protein
MTTATRVHQLRRVNDQKTIQRACETRMAGAEPATISLLEVAELCKRDYAGRPCRDLHAVRNQLFLIATDGIWTAIYWISSRTRACAQLRIFSDRDIGW